MKLLVIIYLISLLLSITACAEIPQKPCNFMLNKNGQRVSWGRHTPIKLHIDNSVPGEYLDAINNAAQVWNEGAGHEVIRIVGWTSATYSPRTDGVNLISFRDKWSEQHNQQAVTNVWWQSSTIYETDVVVNIENFSLSFSNKPQTGKVDIESLLIHEFGHVLGLDHNETAGSVMNAHLDSGYLRRNLSTADLKSISCEY